jgi:multiple sugar transport system ATP-binding protein
MAVGDRIGVLRDGKLQQCGPALTVYRRPANRFVATFIGSAPMNLFRGKLAATREGFQFDDGHLQLLLPQAIETHFENVPTGNIVLGFRPETLRLGRDDVGSEQVCPARPITVRLVVEDVKPLGERVDVRLATGGANTVLARLPADHDYAAGQRLTLTVDSEHLHFFADDEFGSNLARDGLPPAS